VNLFKKAVWISALTSALVLVTSSSTAAGVSTPVQASGTGASPLASCAAFDSTTVGQNFLNAEVEPQLAVRGGSAITMWHQDRWSDGGAHGIGVGFSGDGGKTWGRTTLPLTKCNTDKSSPFFGYLRASDPWVSFGPDGTAYASALAFNVALPDNANAVAVASSTDGGATWPTLQRITGSIFPNAENGTDKNSTTADPIHAGTAYTVWDTLISPTDNPDDNIHAQAFSGPAFFSRTTNGGQTWTPATVMVDTGNRNQTIGNIIVVNPKTDVLYDFFDLIESPNTSFGQGTNNNALIAFVTSNDQGDHWTAPQVIAPFNSLGVHDPNTGKALRVGDGLEEVAVDPNSGQLYVVWESSSNFLKNDKQSDVLWDDEVLLSTSTDGGKSWSNTPTVVERLKSGLPTFTPTVAVNASGTVAVTYYDTRNLTSNQTANLPTDYWVKFSTDGGKSFGNEQHIAGSFDSMTAPVARGFFLGDYEGLQPNGAGGFLAAFVKTNCNATDSAGQIFPTGGLCAHASSNLAPTSNTNPTDVFVAAIS
jgi:hypothetical protein